jgi:hypothetical protein
MKSFKDMLGETVDKIKSPDEQNFVDKHVIDKKEHPVAKDDQFVAKHKKSKRLADRKDGEDEAVYEEEDRMIECPDCGESYKKGEEHECDLEEEMTKAQYAKREEIVKSMKKKMGEFKDKYGDKAKDVMYATATKMAMKEESELQEDVIGDLKSIVKSKSRKRVKLEDGSSLTVDLTTASALTQVHDALNSANQKKFADMMSKNETNFMKAIDFAFSRGKK